MSDVSDTARPAAGRRWWRSAALALPAALMILFGFSLGRDSSVLPSALVGKPVPAVELARLGGGDPVRLSADGGTPTIVNFWASWCGACRTEHGVLVELGVRAAETGGMRLVGINHRDGESNANRFLAEQGAFPYPSAIDRDGRTGVEFGVYGLPETFFIAADGTVMARHVGPLSREQAGTYLQQLGVSP